MRPPKPARRSASTLPPKPASAPMPRRKVIAMLGTALLGAPAIGALLAGGKGCHKAEPINVTPAKPTEAATSPVSAKQIYDEFPAELPGAAQVIKMPIKPGVKPKYCLIHLLNDHAAEAGVDPRRDPRFSQQEAEAVIACRADSKMILEELKNRGFKNIFLEGTTEAGVQRRNAYLGKPLPSNVIQGAEFDEGYLAMSLGLECGATTDTKKVKEDITVFLKNQNYIGDREQDWGSLIEAAVERIPSFKEVIANTTDTIKPMYLLAYKLAVRDYYFSLNLDKQKLLDAELDSIAQNQKLRGDFSLGSELALITLEQVKAKRFIGAPAQEVLRTVWSGKQSIRRMKTLEMIANKPAMRATTIYGAAHDFTNTIDAYNAANPKAQFAYIRVVPRSLTSALPNIAESNNADVYYLSDYSRFIQILRFYGKQAGFND